MQSKNIKKRGTSYLLFIIQSPLCMGSHHWYCNLAAVKKSVEASATARTEAAAVWWELFLACILYVHTCKKNHRGYKIDWIIYPARRNSVKITRLDSLTKIIISTHAVVNTTKVMYTYIIYTFLGVLLLNNLKQGSIKKQYMDRSTYKINDCNK